VGDGDEADARLTMQAPGERTARAVLLPIWTRLVALRVGARLLALLATTACLSGPALAEDLPTGAALAVEMGCYNCHGKAARHDAPSFAELAREFAKHQGDAAAAGKLGAELREGEPFHARIVAHEQLSEDSAAKLMQWLIDGAR